jgi:hypothetical protein
MVEFLRAKRALCAALDNAASIQLAARPCRLELLPADGSGSGLFEAGQGAASCLSQERPPSRFLRLAGYGRRFHPKGGLETKRRARPRRLRTRKKLRQMAKLRMFSTRVHVAAVPRNNPAQRTSRCSALRRTSSVIHPSTVIEVLVKRHQHGGERHWPFTRGAWRSCGSAVAGK